MPRHHLRYRTILLTAVAAVGAGCGVVRGRDRRVVVARIASPDGRAEALVTRDGGCGATCPWNYGVYLVTPGGAVPPDGGWAQFGATSAESLAVRWRDPRTLVVAYRRANVYAFRNRWYLNPRQTATGAEPPYVVEVRLGPTDSVSLAPGE